MKLPLPFFPPPHASQLKKPKMYLHDPPYISLFSPVSFPSPATLLSIKLLTSLSPFLLPLPSSASPPSAVFLTCLLPSFSLFLLLFHPLPTYFYPPLYYRFSSRATLAPSSSFLFLSASLPSNISPPPTLHPSPLFFPASRGPSTQLIHGSQRSKGLISPHPSPKRPCVAFTYTKDGHET